MSNPSKAKGTAHENEVLALLRAVYPQADRAKAGNLSCDFIGCGAWVFEAKHRKAWDLKGWVRKIRAVADGRPWAIFAADGDRRRTDSIGDLVILDRATFLGLLEAARMLDVAPMTYSGSMPVPEHLEVVTNG